MVLPSSRRTGHSRRAQYGTFAGYVIAGLGVMVGGALLIASTRNSNSFSALRTAASDVAVPGGKIAAKGRTETQGFVAAITGFFQAGSQNARLKREAEEARVLLAEAAAVRDENQRLKQLLALREVDPKPVVSVRLVGSTAASTRRFAMLGAGASDGIAVGMPVRSPLGLVGRVLEVGRSSARVLLITDTESVVPVRRAQDGIAAFATGRGDGTLQLRLINLGINPLKRGDAFVTSGAGGLYHPNTAIAVVTRITSDGAIARPLSDPGATEFVVVQPMWQEPARLPATQSGNSASAGTGAE